MTSRKAEDRRAALARRAALGAGDRDAFALRLATLGPRLVLEFAPGGATLVVSLFSAIGDEPDLLPLARSLDAAGVTLALPVTGARDAGLTFRRWRPGDTLVAGPMKIPEPSPAAETLSPDLLFVPLAAFDRRGHRIGYGGGFYDRTLAALRAEKPVRAIGVAYAVQELLFIPSEPHDQPLDLVVTDRDIVLCEA